MNPGSLDFPQTMDESARNSSPSIQTPGNQHHSSSVPVEAYLDNSSNLRNLSPSHDETIDGLPDSPLSFQFEPKEGEEECDPFSLCSPPPLLECWERALFSKSNSIELSHCSEYLPRHGENETEPSSSVSPYCYSETSTAMVGAGLENLGNTCFLNSVLQCFTHTVPLVQDLLSCNHTMSCDRDKDGFCIICALRCHFKLSLSSMDKAVCPLKFVENLSYFSSSFNSSRQEDAHEFMLCLLDKLDRCFVDLKTEDTALSSPDNNIVKQTFGGCLISKLRCCNCGHCSDTYEPFIDLSLEIEHVHTLPSALRSFTNLEKIEDPEANFTCENCLEQVSVEKQLMLDQVPSVAVFHLKRFKNNGTDVEKIDKYVEFPLELDMLPFTNAIQNNSMDLKYHLYAILVHMGSSFAFGHYYCYVRSAPETWHSLDDTKVTRVQEDFVLPQEAYILFYAKQCTPWFSSFFQTQKPLFDPHISNTSPKSGLDNLDQNFPVSGARDVNSCEVNETRDVAYGISEDFLNGSRHIVFGVNEDKDGSPKMCTSVQDGACNPCDRSSYEAEEMCTPPGEKN